ncbi:putative inner membrane complex sub-compartment protein 1 [Gregarina niphandrodes]|uniref:Inner membrane complex sub-compartment protein 1 n=1 Tax=Gregarina niphandrodes TaxID=110365 RepID=A0A023B8H6_GRENI|nr:putative inner membrane complex sub-compartment protein 1 [Gregarina niphandrodes]EZG68908.1 putative inner membrane complex sub-compartment protein 1 [Gregarina niphandrodes]|eukprot:XP_011134532.1 putative inner membrane complex sub-compartment protein 1 [Gregarina niphandrodes]
MSLDELVTVISGRKDLGRVATKANIVDEPTCVALHLASNTCIPILLESLSDKNCFVHLMNELKQ